MTRKGYHSELTGSVLKRCCGMPGGWRRNGKKTVSVNQDLEVLITTAAERGTISVLGTIPPRGFKDPDSKPEAAYNDALTKTCKKLAVPCAHLFEEYLSPERSQLIAKDGVHNTAAGITASARDWRRTVEQVNFVLRDRP